MARTSDASLYLSAKMVIAGTRYKRVLTLISSIAQEFIEL